MALANDKGKLLSCQLVCPSSSTSSLILQALTSFHELLYHSAMDPPRVPVPWFKPSACVFAALEHTQCACHCTPSGPASSLSPRGVGVQLKCRCPPLGFVFMTNRLNNFDKSCCQSHTSFVFAQLFPSCTKIQYHFPSISGKMKINTSTQLCYKLQLLSKR